MDEQRVQAYLSLIQELFDCPLGEENDVLTRRQYLVDEGFVQVCEKEVARLQKEGRENAAQFLWNVAQQVGAFLRRGKTRENQQPTEMRENYFQLVNEILQATLKSGGAPEVVYPLLINNLELVDLNFLKFLQEWAAQCLKQIEEYEKFEYLRALGNFANLMLEFPLGNVEYNVEIGIAALLFIENFYEPEKNREYEIKLKEKNSQNIKKAQEIKNPEERFQTIQKEMSNFFLEVMFITHRMETYANSCSSLMAAYTKKMNGDKSQNIERAIAYGRQALKYFNQENYPNQWGAVYHNMGLSFLMRGLGNKFQNIENAIECLKAALMVRKKETHPQDWADTMTLLGNAYLDRIKGEPLENIRIAINCYFEAQKFLNKNTLSWAILQNNLGSAYSSKLINSRENLEKSIHYLNNALCFYKQDTYPKEWADVKNNLGVIYRNLSMFINEAENLKKADQAYRESLQVRTPNYLPEQYAKTQCNLGVVYSVQNCPKKAESAYQEGLKIYQLDRFPEMWAMIQENLAYVYLPLFKTDSLAFQKIVQYLSNSLKVLKPSEFPLKCMKAASVLGSVAYEQQDWGNTMYGYERVIQSVEQSRNWAISPQAKKNVLQSALPAYGRMIEACLQLNLPDQALLTVERSKARILIELLSSANLVPQNATPEQQERYRQLNREIASLQFPVSDTSNLLTIDPSATGRSLSEIESPTSPQVRYLKTLLQEREMLLEEIDDPDFKAFIEVVPELPDFSQFLSPTTALIEWYLPTEAESGFYAFLVTRQDEQIQITPHHFSAEDRQHLDQALQDYRSDYGKDTWNDQLPQRLETLSGPLQLPRLLAELSQIQQLILIPHRELHLIPLHALPVSLPSLSGSEGQCLQDWFPVQYAPSCQILNNLQQRPPLEEPSTSFFALQNPTEDLTYADFEVEVLRRLFNPERVLRHDEATKTALEEPQNRAFLQQSRYIHFSCHGEFKLDNPNPLNAYLRLANGEKLTFLDIFNDLNIPLCRLLVLSACKTGLVETPPTDDYVGLASAFFFAGTRTVVGSLWEAEEFSAALLMIRLYQELPRYSSVVMALRAAQDWLRTISREGVLTWLQEELKLDASELRRCEKELKLFNKKCPFAPARYWAAFSANGQQ